LIIDSRKHISTSINFDKKKRHLDREI